MPNKKEDMHEMHHMSCMSYEIGLGLKMLVAGILVLANSYWMFMSWGMLIGLLLIIGGILKLAIPHHH